MHKHIDIASIYLYMFMPWVFELHMNGILLIAFNIYNINYKFYEVAMNIPTPFCQCLCSDYTQVSYFSHNILIF